MDGRNDGWMDGWVDGWKDGWAGPWRDGWIEWDGLMKFYLKADTCFFVSRDKENG